MVVLIITASMWQSASALNTACAPFRARIAAGGITKRALAHKYGVTDMIIGGIVRRTRWKHIDPQEITATGQLSLPDSAG